MPQLENSKVRRQTTATTRRVHWARGLFLALVLAACSGDSTTADLDAAEEAQTAAPSEIDEGAAIDAAEDVVDDAGAETDPGADAATQTPTTVPALPASGTFCQVELSNAGSSITWNDDEGRRAVFRVNDEWFYTPDPDEQTVVIPGVVDTNDRYVLRLWNGGENEDVPCSLVENPDAPTSAFASPDLANPLALPTPIESPTGPVQVGFAYGLRGDERAAYWANLDAQPDTGRLLAHEFKSWTREIDTDLYRWHLESGRDLLLTWNGTDAETILNGSQDAWIRQHARELKSLPDTIKLRFWHEPDIQAKLPWIDGDPQQFIDSWNYVRQIFVQEEALNIEWVWCPTAFEWNDRGANYYPGDDAVDWICADGYSGWDLTNPLRGVDVAFIDFQAWANERPDKPILIAEFGAQQRDPGERADWIHDIPNWVNASPNIRAVVYFDVDMRPNGEPFDWRIRTEPDAWQAMLDVISAAPFGA